MKFSSSFFGEEAYQRFEYNLICQSVRSASWVGMLNGAGLRGVLKHCMCWIMKAYQIFHLILAQHTIVVQWCFLLPRSFFMLFFVLLSVHKSMERASASLNLLVVSFASVESEWNRDRKSIKNYMLCRRSGRAVRWIREWRELNTCWAHYGFFHFPPLDGGRIITTP